MAFLSIQRRGRVVTTRAEVHHHGRRCQRPHARRRPSSDPTSRVWSARDTSTSTRDFSVQDCVPSTRNSLASARDSSTSTRLFPPDASGIQSPQPQEISSQTDSDYLEGLGIDETPNGSIYERLGDARRIGSVNEQLDDARRIGSVTERLDDARRIGSVHERLDDARRIGSVNERLDDTPRIGSVHDRLDDGEIMTMLSNV